MDLSDRLPEGVFSDVHFIGSEGRVTGGNCQVFYTPDDGENFVAQDTPELAGKSLIAVYFTSPDKGYVVGNRLFWRYGLLPESCCNIRGDINHDGVDVLDIDDLVYMVSFMFQDGPLPVPCD